MTISVASPFRGCTAQSRDISPAMLGILDLTRPSAFTVGAHNQLVGEGGAIVSAEMVSLTPQTVVYTIDTQLRWSNGRRFSARDLVSWWRSVRSLPYAKDQGYRSIKQLTPSKDLSSVTAVFASPDVTWNSLFRDLEAPGALPRHCSFASLIRRASLGPYRLASLTSSRAVLVRNPFWTENFNRFGRVTLLNSSRTSPASTNFVSYADQTNAALLSEHRVGALLNAKLGTSSLLEELQFAPNRPLTRSAALRRTWSWFVNRQTLVRGLFDSYVLANPVADSALFAQNRKGFVSAPASENVRSLVGASPLLDCLTCARNYLKSQGFSQRASQWRYRERPVTLSIIRGPSLVDRDTTDALVAQLQANGLFARVSVAGSDAQASLLTFGNHYDFAVLGRPFSSSAASNTASLTPPFYGDSFPVGQISASVQRQLVLAGLDFNPLTALPILKSVDQATVASFLVRPLFTPPSLLQWTPGVANVGFPSDVGALIDQVVNWGFVPSR